MIQSLRAPIGAGNSGLSPIFSSGGAAVVVGPSPLGVCISALLGSGWRSTRSWCGAWPRWLPWSYGRSWSPTGTHREPRCRRPLDCGVGILIRLLAARDPRESRDLVDSDLVVSAEYPRVDLHRCDGDVLSRANGVRPTLSIAAVESTKTAFLWPLSGRWSKMRRDWQIA